MLFRALTVVIVCMAWLLPAAAQDGSGALASRDHPLPLQTDVNLITAIDVSDSITRHDEWLQYSGLARGVVDAEFLARIAEGTERRIGFAAFTFVGGDDLSPVEAVAVSHIMVSDVTPHSFRVRKGGRAGYLFDTCEWLQPSECYEEQRG